MPSDEPTKRDPMKYPKKWSKEETFYRDIATRTLSILISGAIIWVGAVILGYAKRPETAAIFWFVLAFAASGVAIFFYHKYDGHYAKKSKEYFRDLAKKEGKDISEYNELYKIRLFNRSILSTIALTVVIMFMFGMLMVAFGPEPTGPISGN